MIEKDSVRGGVLKALLFLTRLYSFKVLLLPALVFLKHYKIYQVKLLPASGKTIIPP